MGLVGSRRPFPILDTSRRRGALPLAPGNQNAAGPRAGDGQGQRAGAVFFRIPSIDPSRPNMARVHAARPHKARAGTSCRAVMNRSEDAPKAETFFVQDGRGRAKKPEP